MGKINHKEIVIVTTTLGNDGAERVLTELSNEWCRMGQKVYIVQIGAENSSSSYELDEQIETISIYKKRTNRIQWYYNQIKDVVKILNDLENATALAFLSRSFYILAVASLFTKNKIVFSERNDPTRWPTTKFSRKVRDLAFCIADRCVFQTKEAMLHFPTQAQKKGCIIPNPCNPNLPQRFIGDRRKIIVTASRLHEQKNLPMLINAFKKFHIDYPEYKLIIFGEGPERETLQKLINSLNLNKYVSLHGFVKNIHSIIADCTMYVCSSNYEGISNSMLEALGMGIPTISTDCPVGGAREVIKNGENGILIPTNDIDALCKAMKRIAGDKVFAEKLSANSCKIRDEYRIESIAQRWLEIL